MKNNMSMIELKITTKNPIKEWEEKMKEYDNRGWAFRSASANERYFVYKEFINEYLAENRDVEKMITNPYTNKTITINRRDVDLNDAESIFIYGLMFKFFLLSKRDIKYEPN